MYTDLQKYEIVNKTESLNELAEVILSFADENGMICGKTKNHDAKKMATYCRNYYVANHNYLTKKFGICQQAMLLRFYNKEK